ANKIFGTVLQKLYLVLSPIIIMLIGAPLFWTNQAPTFSEFEIENDVSATTNTLPSILVIIFDEWDYEVTFPNNQLLDGLPNLRALLDESTLYSKALSAGATTATAIPRFLFQRNPDFLKKSYDEIYDDLYSRRTIEGPSFFKAFDDRYTRAIIGYYLNYPRLLGEDVDFARTMPVGGTLPYWEHMVELLKSQTAILRFVGIHVEEKKLRGEEVLFWNLVEPVHELTTNIIANSTKPVVGIFHYPVPHDPFIYDANGKKTTVDSTQDLSEALRDRQGYLDNLAYLDTLLGQLIQVLKDQGRYEHTLFVATSDHSWRLNADKGVYIAAHEDKKPDSKFKHVPLIIHEPGQTEGRLVDEPFPLVNFYNYLEAYLERTYPDAIQK
ncbi:MAG: sulfatase-like hydrolase/transferase, partial [Verrucomicrobiota bacterium]